MSKKIPSDLPKPRLFEELKKEFSVYVDRFRAWFKKIADRYPSELFLIMVVSMILSIVFAFFITENPAKNKTARALDVAKYSGKHLDDRFQRILSNTDAIAEIRKLDRQLDAILHSDSLSEADSIAFFTIAHKLDSIRNTF